MKYDDASWHYGGDFPEGLPSEAGATHIGMFVAWGLLNGLAGILYTDEFPEDLERLRSRQLTPGQFLIECSDEKFVDEDLNDEGNAFAEAYFNDMYISDYESILASNLPSTYHVSDTWENFDKLSPIIAKRFSAWKEGKLDSETSLTKQLEDKPWWKVW